MDDEPPKTFDIDLDVQMREIEKEMSQRAPSPQSPPKENEGSVGGVAIKPLLQGLEGLSRAVAMQGVSLSDLVSASKTGGGQGEKLDRLLAGLERVAHFDLAKTDADLGWIKDTLQRVEGRDQANQKLFDAMHEELQSYKDSFMFDVLQKPVIRDMIALFDELQRLSLQMHRLQTSEVLGTLPETAGEEFGHVSQNLSHQVDYLLEVLLRLDVEKMSPVEGKLDRKLHKAMQMVPTDDAEADQDIIEELKPGFSWRGRLFRPPEVKVKKFTPAP